MAVIVGVVLDVVGGRVLEVSVMREETGKGDGYDPRSGGIMCIERALGAFYTIRAWDLKKSELVPL